MADDALRNSYARMAASAMTWPIEKCKLLYQAQSMSSSSSSSTSSAAIQNAPTRTCPQATANPVVGGGAATNRISIINIGGAVTVANRFVTLPWTHHVMGITSSALQRGGSAFFMFYAQSTIYDHVLTWRTHPLTTTTSDDEHGPLSHQHQQQHHQQQQYNNNNNNNFIGNQALAGFLSGMITAPFHTYWELIKVRGTFPTHRLYLLALPPMICRHAIFDGIFFGTQATLVHLAATGSRVPTSDVAPQKVGEDEGGTGGWTTTTQVAQQLSSSSGIRFGLSAALASMGNLLWDVWKTRQMSVPSAIPSTSLRRTPLRRVFFLRDVVGTMTVPSFWRQYLVKGTDLTANWFVRVRGGRRGLYVVVGARHMVCHVSCC
jgi:hypothetical protein